MKRTALTLAMVLALSAGLLLAPGLASAGRGHRQHWSSHGGHHGHDRGHHGGYGRHGFPHPGHWLGAGVAGVVLGTAALVGSIVHPYPVYAAPRPPCHSDYGHRAPRRRAYERGYDDGYYDRDGY